MLDDLRVLRRAHYRDNIFANVYAAPGMEVHDAMMGDRKAPSFA